MDASRLDRISKSLAQRLSRRRTLAQGAAGLVAGTLAATGISRRAATQDATPEPDAEHGPEMLFVQTYQSGTIAPVDGAEGRYTLTLEAGTGQTIYFSDRPDRLVGTSATPQFLERLGFPPDNPPNAALVVETDQGETDVAVVELFNPLYDPITHGVTYEVEVLANWEDSLGVGFAEAPIDLATLAPSFGAAQLFIDDCADMTMECVDMADLNGPTLATIDNSVHDGFCYSYGYGACLPCQPWFSGLSGRVQAGTYWTNQCRALSGCRGHNCVPRSVCSDLIGCR